MNFAFGAVTLYKGRKIVEVLLEVSVASSFHYIAVTSSSLYALNQKEEQIWEMMEQDFQCLVNYRVRTPIC